jgi:hypothetical protein
VHTLVVDGPILEFELSLNAWTFVRADPQREPDAVAAGTPNRLPLAWWTSHPSIETDDCFSRRQRRSTTVRVPRM